MTDTAAPAPAAAQPGPSAASASHTLIIVALLVAHIPIAFAMRASVTIATAHAVLTLIAVLWVLGTGRNASTFAAAAGYVAGAEVLWRQTAAAVPWELAKYLLMLIFLIGIIRFVGRPTRIGLPLLYLGALLPACAVPFVQVGPFASTDPISFNIGAAIALAIGVIFFSQLAGTWWSVRGALWGFIAPVVAIVALATSASRSLGASDFINESNPTASGGFGPNQVAAVLGLAALFCIFLALREHPITLRVTCVALALWFMGQGLLTFSRGGLVNMLLALIVALPHLILRRDTASRFFGILLTVALIGTLVVLPRLAEFTGGELEERFTSLHEKDTRTYLAQQDWEAFLNHPLLGIGVGEGEAIRSRIGNRVSAHTEWTRLLAEHGILGVVSAGAFLAMGFRAYRRQGTMWGRAWTAALFAWTTSELTHSASRLAAISFTFALAMLTLLDDDPAPDDGPPEATPDATTTAQTNPA